MARAMAKERGEMLLICFSALTFAPKLELRTKTPSVPEMGNSLSVFWLLISPSMAS